MVERGTDSDSLVGETLLGRYTVEARVAEGGFAVVYRARHVELGVPVAIKVLNAEARRADEAFLAMFRREARTVAALNHSALVRVLDYGAHGEHPWIAMEWLEGATLEDDLRERAGAGRSPREALELLRPAFEGLACAHAAGVSHRDVKPSNLMLVAAPQGAPALRVIDFGVAKVDDVAAGAGSGSTRTAAAVVAFSAPYAAPEQVTRTRTGPWTDVHALALVLVELLAGERAYGETSGAELVEEALRTERPTPGRLGVEVGPWEAVLARALARLPSARPANAAALWSELASSAAEAQAAWVNAPRARATRPDASSAVTRVEGSTDATPSPAPATRTAAPASTATAELRARIVPPGPRVMWFAAAALVGLAAFAVSSGRAAGSRRAPIAVPASTVAAPVAVAALVAAPPVTPPSPAPAAPDSPPPLAARRLVRRPSPPRPRVDSGAPVAVSAAAEPTVVVE